MAYIHGGSGSKFPMYVNRKQPRGKDHKREPAETTGKPGRKARTPTFLERESQGKPEGESQDTHLFGAKESQDTHLFWWPNKKANQWRMPRPPPFADRISWFMLGLKENLAKRLMPKANAPEGFGRGASSVLPWST